MAKHIFNGTVYGAKVRGRSLGCQLATVANREFG